MFHKATLDNGIRLVAETTTGFRSLCIGVWVRTGSRDEEPQISGISHFLEHMHFKGTNRRTAQDIANEIDGLGGELNAFTSREGTTYYVKVLDDHLEPGLDLLADIICSSCFAPEDIEREKGPVIEEIRMVEDSPEDFVHDLLQADVWPETGLGRSILGSEDTVRKFEREHLLNFIEKSYTTDEIVLAAAGNFCFDRLADLCRDKFQGLTRRGRRPRREKPGFQRGAQVYSRDLSEVHVCMGLEGLPQDHDDRYALYVLNAVLGSGVSSRLFQEIREKRGLAYSVYSYLSFYIDTGMVGIYTGTGPDRVIEVLDLVRGELRALTEEPLPEDEIHRAKEQLKGNLILGLESTSARMSQIARDEIYFERLFAVEDILKGIEAVNAEQMLAVAAELLSPDRLAVTALGPLEEDLFRRHGFPGSG